MDTTESQSENECKVIQFRPLDEPRFLAKKKDKPFCKHGQTIVVDDQNRIIECSVCGAVLDPFDYFWQLAQEETGLVNHIRHFKSQREVLAKEVELLEKKLKSLKSSLRTQQKAIPA